MGSAQVETPIGNIRFAVRDAQGVIADEFISLKVGKPAIKFRNPASTGGAGLIEIHIAGDQVQKELWCHAELPAVLQDLASPSPGERLETLVAHLSGTSICLATQDGDHLNQVVPERLRIEPGGFLDWVSVGNGLRVVVPELRAAEDVRIFFSVVWKCDADPEDIEAWLLADHVLLQNVG
jgi:hypothetical protein